MNKWMAPSALLAVTMTCGVVYAANEDVSKQIQMLNSQIQVQMETMQATQQKQMKALNTRVQTQLNQMQTTLQDQIQTLKKQTDEQIKQLTTSMQQQKPN